MGSLNLIYIFMSATLMIISLFEWGDGNEVLAALYLIAALITFGLDRIENLTQTMRDVI